MDNAHNAQLIGIETKPYRKIGPLFIPKHFKDAKDPCICFDGARWHIYGSGGNVSSEEWRILHASAPEIEGPWTELEPIRLTGLAGPHVAAPSVIYDANDGLFHMCIQEDFMAVGGGIEYLVSADGERYSKMHSILGPLAGSPEAGLYDPHFSEIGGRKYMCYAGIPALNEEGKPFVPQPDVYMAESTTGLWSGPWQRVRKILDHDDIGWHHNKRGSPDYEWGIEGPQLVGLPNGQVLLNATCFLEEGRRGTRQRVFFAIADAPEGPYKSLGPVLADREAEWESGENGHASAWVKDDTLYLFYQARSQADPQPTMNDWRYGIAIFRLIP